VNLVSRIAMTAGFCAGTVGATGFGETVEPLAWPLFVGGLGVVAFVGIAEKLASRSRAGDGEELHGEKQRFLEMITAIRDRVVEIDDGRATLSPEEVRQGIDHLLTNEYFDLTSRNEELIALLGFQDYARVWEGVATAERLLSRAWSMATDGHPEQGFESLPRARTQIEAAAEAMAQV